MKTLFISFSRILTLAALFNFFIGCSKSGNYLEDKEHQNIINTTPIYSDVSSLTKGDTPAEVIGYHCSSPTSEIVCDVFPGVNDSDAKAVLLGSDNEEVATIFIDYSESSPNGDCRFIMSNEMNEPFISGIYNPSNGKLVFDTMYGNYVPTKSTFGFICNMGLGTVAGIWGTAVGIAAPGAGFVVTLAFTAFNYWYCDKAEKNMQTNENKTK